MLKRAEKAGAEFVVLTVDLHSGSIRLYNDVTNHGL
jgi:hypothetical protein